MRRVLIALAAITAAACSPGSGAQGSEHRDAPAPARDSAPAARPEVITNRDTVRSGLVALVDSTGEPPFIEPTATNLSGAWAAGSGEEPSVRHIVLRPPCNFTPGYWSLEQQGDTVRAYTMPPSWAKGIATPVRSVIPETEGRMRRGLLSLGKAPTGYRLHFDSANGHLRGTFNGAPFWAVPLHIVWPKRCIDVR